MLLQVYLSQTNSSHPVTNIRVNMSTNAWNQNPALFPFFLCQRAFQAQDFNCPLMLNGCNVNFSGSTEREVIKSKTEEKQIKILGVTGK